ncbi:MAG: BACON domain-containing protein [Bacteroidaceae bacterium]|nr:BACON domain-containing protein [Bacteroidaceae bacterium]
MALNKQVWLNTIVENFFTDDSFATKSIDDSVFVDHKSVHIPNAGAPSGVVTNRSQKPASVNQRADNDLSYDMDELTTNPIYIPNIDMVELSYDKRQSIIQNDRMELQKQAHQNLLYRWFVAGQVIETAGDAVDAHTSSTASGKRKALTKDTILQLMTRFNQDDVPATGRYILLDAVMYAQLLKDLTEKELSAFLASADAQKGILGNLYGFDIMQRSKVLRLTADMCLLKWEENGAAGELAAGLAWQEQCVSRAVGEMKMFDKMDDPTYYGDIYSFLMRVGGSHRRYDKKGICVIAESAVTEESGLTIEGDESLHLTAEAGSNVRTYATSNGAAITAESDSDWLRVSVSGKKVTFTRTAYAYDAEGDELRTAEVTIGIAGTDVTKVVTVTQAMAENA